MKIGIDARMYGAESTTGIGVYIKNLIDELFEIGPNNEYVLFMLEPAFSNFQPPNNQVKKVKVNCRWYSWSEQLIFPVILLRHKLDLVHFTHFNVPVFYPKKFILTIHDITPYFFPGPIVKKAIIRKIGYQTVFKLGIKRAKKIITVSNHTKNNLINFFKISEEKIKVIYLGVDQKFKPTLNKELLDNLKKKYNITKPFLFYIGVWRNHKNLPGLIEAFNILKSKNKLDYQLVLGGKPDPKYPENELAIKNSPFKSDIILPGFISEDELPLFYNAAKLFVLPSFCEGFGLVALESLVCGTPVVGSKTTSLPEILEDSAIYFDPKDSKAMAETINQVASNPDLYQSLRNRGLNQNKKYSWLDCAKKTLRVYQSV